MVKVTDNFFRFITDIDDHDILIRDGDAIAGIDPSTIGAITPQPREYWINNNADSSGADGSIAHPFISWDQAIAVVEADGYSEAVFWLAPSNISYDGHDLSSIDCKLTVNGDGDNKNVTLLGVNLPVADVTLRNVWMQLFTFTCNSLKVYDCIIANTTAITVTDEVWLFDCKVSDPQITATSGTGTLYVDHTSNYWMVTNSTPVTGMTKVLMAIGDIAPQPNEYWINNNADSSGADGSIAHPFISWDQAIAAVEADNCAEAVFWLAPSNISYDGHDLSSVDCKLTVNGDGDNKNVTLLGVNLPVADVTLRNVWMQLFTFTCNSLKVYDCIIANTTAITVTDEVWLFDCKVSDPQITATSGTGTLYVDHTSNYWMVTNSTPVTGMTKVLMAIGGDGYSIDVFDEDVLAQSAINKLNFMGAGVTATAGDAGEAVVTIPGNQTVMRQDIFDPTSGQTSFVLQHLPIDQASTELFIDGVSQTVGTDYTLSVQTVVYSGTPALDGNEVVVVKYFEDLAVTGAGGSVGRNAIPYVTFVDPNSTSTAAPDGSYENPFLTVAAAVDATEAGAFRNGTRVFYLAPATYTEESVMLTIEHGENISFIGMGQKASQVMAVDWTVNLSGSVAGSGCVTFQDMTVFSTGGGEDDPFWEEYTINAQFLRCVVELGGSGKMYCNAVEEYGAVVIFEKCEVVSWPEAFRFNGTATISPHRVQIDGLSRCSPPLPSFFGTAPRVSIINAIPKNPTQYWVNNNPDTAFNEQYSAGTGYTAIVEQGTITHPYRTMQAAVDRIVNLGESRATIYLAPSATPYTATTTSTETCYLKIKGEGSLSNGATLAGFDAPYWEVDIENVFIYPGPLVTYSLNILRCEIHDSDITIDHGFTMYQTKLTRTSPATYTSTTSGTVLVDTFTNFYFIPTTPTLVGLSKVLIFNDTP